MGSRSPRVRRTRCGRIRGSSRRIWGGRPPKACNRAAYPADAGLWPFRAALVEELLMALLEIDNIETFYGNIRALKGVSLKVEEGEVVTLIGSNGAGKTTTLRTISALIKPRHG